MSRRPGSLRGRLTAGMVVVLLVAGLVVGVVSELFVRHFLLARVDEQLVSAGGRYAASLEHPAHEDSEDRAGVPDTHDHDADDVIPGQAEGTLGIRVRHGRITQAGVVGDDGVTRRVSLDPASAAAVRRVRPDTGAHSVDLHALGDYRVRAVSGEHGEVQVTGLPLDPVDETLAELLVVEVALFAGLVVVGGVAAGVVVRRSLRPLDQLSSNALEVSTLALTGGDEPLPTTAAPAQSAREVDQVSEAFDRMLERVRHAMSARDATEARLRRFVADASHELRTPLATIRASAEYGANPDGAPLPEATADALVRIRAAADRMGMLVSDLLLLARLDAGRPLQRQEVDLTRLVLDAVADARTAAPDHHWELDLPEEAVTVEGDEERLRQVLANLLTNARTHTPPGTTVTTGIRVAADHVEAWVADDGPGVPAELQPELFERFTRGDTSRSRAHGSTGLGLAIAHGITRAHDGTLVHESPSSGGSRFRLRLPSARRADPVDAEPAHEAQVADGQEQ
ncbi:MAG TPA: HAMP domain-containing sensor histidine kinase [Motilibacteraceae bacterium]|nr:HAMP domain-containing sensor histidine kinase [Motilibacteraceae bacterium]